MEFLLLRSSKVPLIRDSRSLSYDARNERAWQRQTPAELARHQAPHAPAADHSLTQSQTRVTCDAKEATSPPTRASCSLLRFTPIHASRQ